MKNALKKIKAGYCALPMQGACPRSPRYTKIVDGKLVTIFHEFGNEHKVFETFTFDLKDENKTWEWQK